MRAYLVWTGLFTLPFCWLCSYFLRREWNTKIRGGSSSLISWYLAEKWEVCNLKQCNQKVLYLIRCVVYCAGWRFINKNLYKCIKASVKQCFCLFFFSRWVPKDSPCHVGESDEIKTISANCMWTFPSGLLTVP